MNIDPLIQLQMVRDWFIDGQAECALLRHLDSLGPDTPMADIVDCPRVWESHIELASSRQMGTDRHSPCEVCQVTEEGQLSRRRLNHWRTSLESCCRRRRSCLRRRQGSPLSATNGSDSPVTASCAGTITIDRFGDYVTELASGWCSHGRGCHFAEFAVGFSRGVFFIQGLDPHDGSMSDTGRVVSVLA